MMDLDQKLHPEKVGPMTPFGEIKHDIWGNTYLEPYKNSFLTPADPTVEADAKAQADAVGIWKVPPQHAKALNDNRPNPKLSYGAPASFRYDGQYVTLQLCKNKAWMWGPEDDCFRVKAKWEGNDLYWLPPFGGWTKLATIANGRFEERTDYGVVWKFERVGPEFLADYEQHLADEREPHDYAITPMGERRPGWRLDDE
jgi:hypothetical protein